MRIEPTESDRTSKREGASPLLRARGPATNLHSLALGLMLESAAAER